MDRYVIGIDTGGTFTDGVLLHYESRKVISAAKSLTTREDLKIGVIKVLKKLNIKEEYSIKLVGISSTLATNSVAEGKARKAAFIPATADDNASVTGASVVHRYARHWLYIHYSNALSIGGALALLAALEDSLSGARLLFNNTML